MKTLRYAVLFLTGFCTYITIEVCYRGYSYPLMGLCGGIILIVIDSINEKISWYIDILLQGIIGSFIVTGVELIVGGIFFIFNLNPMWDYSNVPFNFYGIISLPYSLIWIVISILGIILADVINYYVFNIQPVPYYKFFGHTIFKFKEKASFVKTNDANNL
ncbi:MAG: hypothetical protein E7404_01055 [Ruminococcaceae bacterium]|nr:hypothetical protein [Oscillospiraceae bacterium]